MSEQLYVALTEDGTYLKKVVVKSIAGTRTKYENVSLTAADALPKHLWTRCDCKFILVPATVSRIVTIVIGEEEA